MDLCLGQQTEREKETLLRNQTGRYDEKELLFLEIIFFFHSFRGFHDLLREKPSSLLMFLG
jgi:hypothetical protein